MRAQSFIFLVLLSVALAYTLPDLGINQSGWNCNNVQSLQSIANSDLNRMRTLINSINSRINDLNTIFPLLDTIKQKTSEIKSLTLLQTKTGSRLGTSYHGLLLKAKKIINYSLDGEDPVIVQIIGDDLQKIQSAMIELSSQVDQATILNLVTRIQSAVQDLINYLNWAQAQINSQWVSYLNTRISQLNAAYTACITPVYSYTLTAQYGGNGGNQFANDPTNGLDRYYLKAINVHCGDTMDGIQVIITDGVNTINQPYHGGGGGTPYYITIPNGVKVTRIDIWYDVYPKGIKLYYSNGQTAGPYGRTNYAMGTINVNGDIVGIAGRSGSYMDKLGFIVKTPYV